MITKAYIQEVLSPYAVRVRIPIYHKIEGAIGATIKDLLPIAYISTPPNVHIDPKVNDIVIVSFEEEDMSKPIVIGYLYTDKPAGSSISIECDSLVVNEDVKIGDVVYTNIACLKNQTENIKDILDRYDRRLQELEKSIKDINKE